MFDSYVSAGARDRRRRWVTGATITSVLVHAAGAVALVLWSFWTIDRLSPKYVPVSFRGDPGLPGPVAGGGTPRSAPSATPVTPTHGVVQPRKHGPAEVGPVAAAPGPGGPGGPGPVVDVISDRFGDCLDCRPDGTEPPPRDPTPVGAPATPPVATTVKAAPKNVAPSVVAALRVSGQPQIDPPADFYDLMRSAGKQKVVVPAELCLSVDGVPTSVELGTSTGSPEYDRKIDREMRAWRYRPYRVDGQPIPVCTVVTFVIVLQ